MKSEIRRYFAPIAVSAAVILITGIGWLRESGHLGMNLYKSDSGEVASSVSVESGRHSGNRASQVLASPKRVLQSPVNRDLWAMVDRDLSGVMTRPGTRLIVETLDIKGSYGTPLYKTGTCDYKIDLADGVDFIPPGALNGPGKSGREARLTGTIDLKVSGICSRREYMKLLAEKIAPKIRTEASHFTTTL